MQLKDFVLTYKLLEIRTKVRHFHPKGLKPQTISMKLCVATSDKIFISIM